jgi:hypothetical protein
LGRCAFTKGGSLPAMRGGARDFFFAASEGDAAICQKRYRATLEARPTEGQLESKAGFHPWITFVKVAILNLHK